MSELERMQQLLMKQFFEQNLQSNDTLAKKVLIQQLAS